MADDVSPASRGYLVPAAWRDLRAATEPRGSDPQGSAIVVKARAAETILAIAACR